jgi:hypothetical protein
MPITLRGSIARSHVAVALLLLSFHGSALAADLIGVVLRGGNPLPNTTVELRYDGAVAGSAKSSAAGRFVIRNVRPGTYEMKCGDGPVVRIQVADGLNQANCQG